MAHKQNIFLCLMLWLTADSTIGQKINFGRPGSGPKLSPNPNPPSPPPGIAADGTANNQAAGFAPAIPKEWVYCGNEWRRVTKYDCPMVFLDPDFSEHQNFCRPRGLSTDEYDGTNLWFFNPSPGSLYRWPWFKTSTFVLW